MLVSHLVNVRWLTGFTGSSGTAVIGPDAHRFLTDFRYLSQSEEQLDGSWQREIVQDLLESAVGGLPTEGAVRLGFDDEHMSVKQHAKLQRLAPENVELVAAGGLIEDLRMVKDAEEIARIRAAATSSTFAGASRSSFACCLTDMWSSSKPSRTAPSVGSPPTADSRRSCTISRCQEPSSCSSDWLRYRKSVRNRRASGPMTAVPDEPVKPVSQRTLTRWETSRRSSSRSASAAVTRSGRSVVMGLRAPG